MMKYATYKDSGIDWLGDVPSHWNNYRFDLIGKLIRGNTGFKKDELLSQGEYVALQYGKTYKVDEVDNQFQYYVNDEYYKKSQVVNYGNTILISTSETIEDLGHSCFYKRDELGLIGGEQILVKPYTKLIDDKYLYYYSKKFSSELQKYASGLKVFRFNIDDLKQIFIAIPELEEQKTIAQYLDTKMLAIDKKVRLLVKKIDYYTELRKSIIKDAVTKGLDKKVELKDSGVDWIGQIPNHWEVKRGKDILLVKYGVPLDSKLFSNKPNEGFPLIRIRDIQSNTFQTYYQGEVPQNGIITEGAILCGMDGDFNVVRWQGKSAILNQRICELNIKGNRDYLFYFLPFAMDEINSQKSFTTVKHLSDADLKVIKITLPPTKKEQTEIAQYLDDKVKTIDAIVSKTGMQIAHLKELRKSLINDVVTGKIKVIE